MSNITCYVENINIGIRRNTIMATPTKKSTNIDNLLESITGRSRVKSVTDNICVSCGEGANEFDDEISVKEYNISGLCQGCQDSVFG